MMISKELVQCTDDMRQVAQCGKMSLDAVIRAYDLLEKIMDLPGGAEVGPADVYSDTVARMCSSLGPAEEFCAEYARLSDMLDGAYDEAALKEEAGKRMKPFEEAFAASTVLASERTALHQCAKETFEIWQSKGFIARQSALRRLRSLAGFRLESDRIGNFVAKTFDLMNEAQAAQARAQQALFSANVSYKIRPGLYSRIASALQFRNL